MSTMVWVVVHSGGIQSSASSVAISMENMRNNQIEGSQLDGKQAPMNADQQIRNDPKKLLYAPAVEDKLPEPEISVYLTKSQRVETVPLETYVKGVVAAEMPLDFERAALEAQALAARTYIVRRLWLNDRTGVPVDGAIVTDTQNHQVYRSEEEMKQLLRDNKAGWTKIEQAVQNTKGKVIVYGDEPIEALFFSTSNGYTEDSEEVFPAEVPYLRSVASPWDKEGSPRVRETVEMTLSRLYTQLGVDSIAASGFNSNMNAEQNPIRVTEWTEGRRVKQFLVGNLKLTGEEVRHKLGLRSASFDIHIDKSKVTITTYGSGHGVGMSQWGAQGMAKAGKTARQIVEHYYSGVRIEEVSKLVNSKGIRHK